MTHAGAQFPCVKAYTAKNILNIAEDYDVIGIDEIQFFEESTLVAILHIIRDRTVIVSGLDTNFRYEPFGIMPKLMAYAEKVDKLSAICNKCGLEATRTQRLINGEPAPLSGPEILIGGLESYEARCRECFQIG
jgi:thymidine kinase